MKKQKGITLIALIITIVLLLILAVVVIGAVRDGNVIRYAQNAEESYTVEQEKEKISVALSEWAIQKYTQGGKTFAEYMQGKIEGATVTANEDGTITVAFKNNTYKVKEDGTIIQENLNEEPEIELPKTEDPEEIELPEGLSVAETKPEGWSENVTAITDGTYTIPLPNEYQVSQEDGEGTVAEGLVITDGENEFVWIPVETDFKYGSGPVEAYEIEYEYDEETDEEIEIITMIDTQETLDKYYGEGYYTYPQTEAEKADANNAFAYKGHYNEMVASVNKYDGFYVGRYETTIDGNNIGSKENATVLSSDMAIAQTNNKPVRWWGLYDVQRRANIKGNGNIVQTNMIFMENHDVMIRYFKNQNKDYLETSVEELATAEEKQNAGQAKYTYNSKTISDEIYNIYDLRRNVYEWNTGFDGDGAWCRQSPGGSYDFATDADYYEIHDPATCDLDELGSRLILYIK